MARVVLLWLLIGVGVGCTKVNPNICCVTDEQCQAFGLSEHRPCESGLACDPVKATCEAAQCQTAVDCDASAPLCVNNLCVATCTADADCTGIADKPYCLTSAGTCVGCLDASVCPADKQFCDADTHACRGCQSDDQCSSGVCVEADGTCADSSQLLYVSSVGADTGDCTTSGSPCASVTYALTQANATRSIIRVTGGSLPTATSTIHLTKAVVIDGDGTTFDAPSAGPSFDFANPVSVTMEGIAFTTTTGSKAQTAITVGVGSSLRLFNVAMNLSIVDDEGSLDAQAINAMNISSLTCTSGTLSLRSSTFDDKCNVQTMNCAVSISQNRFSSGNFMVDTTGGLVTIENNIFIATNEFVDAITVGENAPGSIVAFNTFVDTSTVVQSPAAIHCDGTSTVTSDIFAYNSSAAILGCSARASLFDLEGAPDAVGTSVSADPATFFVNRDMGDYHLAPQSPAIGLGETGIVTVDFDGNPRPSAAGSKPAAGAYEAPP